MAVTKSVFVLLVGSEQAKTTDHYQALQEQAALEKGTQGGLDVQVAWASAFDQYKTLRLRVGESARPPDAVVTEPASQAAIELILKLLKGRTGLVLLNAWDPAVERYLADWGGGLPVGTISTPHSRIGELQGRQLSAAVPPSGRVLVVTGPANSPASSERLAGLRETLRPDLSVHETHAGDWTEGEGGAAFGSWYRVFRSRRDRVHAIAGQSDELAVGAHHAACAVAERDHAEAFRKAKLFGVDGCPDYGRALVDSGVLHATVRTPANTGLAITLLQRYWNEGRPLPAQSFTDIAPYPPASIGP
jgi:ABC-type sugar transport system substrate-binding protein